MLYKVQSKPVRYFTNVDKGGLRQMGQTWARAPQFTSTVILMLRQA